MLTVEPSKRRPSPRLRILSPGSTPSREVSDLVYLPPMPRWSIARKR
jgi:hypothetical protein